AVATSELMKKYDVAIWAHHGTFCSGETLDLAFGLMDTVEKAAEILVKVLSMGGKKQTIQAHEFKELGEVFKVDLNPECLK
ncbi:MAG: class II aldolase/adducin family protein, partial [Cetobacterium sp.]